MAGKTECTSFRTVPQVFYIPVFLDKEEWLCVEWLHLCAVNGNTAQMRVTQGNTISLLTVWLGLRASCLGHQQTHSQGTGSSQKIIRGPNSVKQDYLQKGNYLWAPKSFQDLAGKPITCRESTKHFMQRSQGSKYYFQLKLWTTKKYFSSLDFP